MKITNDYASQLIHVCAFYSPHEALKLGERKSAPITKSVNTLSPLTSQSALMRQGRPGSTAGFTQPPSTSLGTVGCSASSLPSERERVSAKRTDGDTDTDSQGRPDGLGVLAIARYLFCPALLCSTSDSPERM